MSFYFPLVICFGFIFYLFFGVRAVFFFQFSHVASKMAIGPRRGLAKYGYKSNREVENPGILCEPLESVN